MAGGMGMFGGVAVRRIVAAEGGAALLTGAKVDPSGANLHAFFALATFCRLDSRHGADM